MYIIYINKYYIYIILLYYIYNIVYRYVCICVYTLYLIAIQLVKPLTDTSVNEMRNVKNATQNELFFFGRKRI